MPIDYLIGALIAAATVVNALALGAFWITPGLRTTANRFVINLLIVNLVGCVALTPSLFGGWTIDARGDHADEQQLSLSSTGQPSSSALDAILNGTVRELIDLDADIERAVELVSESAVMQAVAAFVDGPTATIAGDTSSSNAADDNAAAVRIDAMPMQRQTAIVFWGNTRYWGFDLTAALGKWIIRGDYCVRVCVVECHETRRGMNNVASFTQSPRQAVGGQQLNTIIKYTYERI